MHPVLEIQELKVEGRTPAGDWVPTLRGVSLSVAPGEIVALVGESGAGKTTVGLAALGYMRQGMRKTGGTVRLNGTDIFALDAAGRRSARGRMVAYVAQSAQAALNPALPIGEQVAEPILLHGLASPAEARQRAIELLATLDLPAPTNLSRKYPSQASGGQQQRVMAAMALSCGPSLLVLDEPTTALDVTTQIEVLMAFKEAIHARRSAAVYVSHDLSVVAQLADRIVVMKDGAVVETERTEAIIGRPTQTYTRHLIEAHRPQRRISTEPGPAATQDRPLLEIEHIAAAYPGEGWRPSAAPVLQDVTFSLRRREILALVGESGSGKSTLARVIAGLHPAAAGALRLDGRALAPRVRRRDRDSLRRIQLVAQSPDLSLNPRQRIGAAISRPLRLYFGLGAHARATRVAELLTAVGLPPSYAERLPAELSGGQRQRVSIARALAAEPDLLLCDEILASLDSIVAAQIRELIGNLRAARGTAYLFISHDLAAIASLADRVAVLYAGRLCEIGPTSEVFRPPHHPYTALLQSSVPALRPGWLEEVIARRQTSDGAGSAAPRDTGCPFRHRCPVALPGRCEQPPPARHIGANRVIYCHRDLEELVASA